MDWTNLVGKTAEEAKTQILHDKADAEVQILPENSPCTRDFRFNRVRVFVNA
jgi:hypothetical protein